MVSQGDTILAINGKSMVDLDGNPLDAAVEELGAVGNGVDIKLTLESDVLMTGYMHKKGEKGLTKSWQRRFFVLVWSELNVAEREIRYYEGQDYCARKLKGAIDLSRAESVTQENVSMAKDGAASAGIHIRTPGRLWELVPETAAEAKTWFQVIEQLLSRKKGFDVVASMSNLAFSPDQMLEGEEPGQQQGESIGLETHLGPSLHLLLHVSARSPPGLLRRADGGAHAQAGHGHHEARAGDRHRQARARRRGGGVRAAVRGRRHPQG